VTAAFKHIQTSVSYNSQMSLIWLH